MKTQLIHGDCLQRLKELPDNSVDSVVTDPPYGLSFMGKRWDYDVPSEDIWRECLRVLKPGGHLLAFAGTRTQHRMAVRIEDAGFEIRDMIAWVYGSGFPKSLDVSKAIDKARVEDKEPVRMICRVIREAMDASGFKSKDLVGHFGGCHPRLVDHWAARDTDSQPSLPTWNQWQTLRDLLGIDSKHDAEVWRLNNRKGLPGDAWNDAEVVAQHKGTTPGFGDHRFSVRDSTIRSATDAAKQWAGWGTALKPALEPITVARKPFKGTVAANVLEHGTGALNVDGCRVDGAPPSVPQPVFNSPTGRIYGMKTGEGRNGEMSQAVGRWPANFCHDGSDEVVGLFPQTSSGLLARHHRVSGSGGASGFLGESMKRDSFDKDYGNDSGSAARFFYCAKASKADRDGSTHPTMKPTTLMRYLCRLVTPPGGTVLDPFMGSGSTGKAAMLEGFSFIGIEREVEYLAIAEARIKHAQPEPELFKK